MRKIIIFLILILMVSTSYSQTKVDLAKFKMNNNIAEGEAGIIALNQYPSGLEIIVKSRKSNPIKLSFKFYDSNYNETKVEIYAKANAITKQMASFVNINKVAEVMQDKTEDISCDGMNNDIIGYAENGNIIGVFCALANDVDIEAKDNYGYTALILASARGNIDIVKYLVEKGANIESKDNDGETALMSASYYGKTDTVKYLIEKGANIESKANDGRMALMRASANGRTDTVKYLIEKGANIESKDNDGWTALIYASSNDKTDTVKYLLSMGANRHAKNNNGDTACDFSGWTGEKDC